MPAGRNPRPRRRSGAAPGPGTAVTRRRSLAFLVVVCLGLVTIAARLTQVQAVGASGYAAIGENQRVRKITLAAERGSVFDRNGVDLAISVSEQTVWANPRVVTDPAGYAAKLAPVLRVDQKLLESRLAKEKQAFVYLARKVDQATAEAVRQLDLDGVDFVPESKRFYPSGSVAAPVLGNVGLDNQGLAGLEVTYESKLAGKPGQLVVERDPSGRRIPQGRYTLKRAVRGEDLILTIDQALQYETERALQEAVASSTAKGGLAIVSDVRTGAMLAMANVVGDGDGGARPANAGEKNRAVTDVYEPGSTNKVITMSAAIEEKLVTPETHFRVPDKLAVGNHVFSDHDAHPPIDWTVKDILSQSSNIGTIMVAQKLGKEKLDHYLREFGFGKKTGIGFPGEPSGLLLDPKDYYITSMGTVPIGNGLAVSALQMLGAYSIVATGGVWRTPHIVGATVDGAGRRTPVDPGPARRVISEGTANSVREMLRSVVDTGTGSNAAIGGYSVAGKTGTARKPLVGLRGYSGEYVASFAGFVPAEAPRLAAVVVLDEPRPIYGGQVAAPVFSRILSYALRLEKIPPPPVPPVEPAPAEAEPRTADPAVGGGTLPAGSGGTSTAPQGDGRREQTPAPGR